MAGTDRFHQDAFTQSAEMHRRAMIKMLNEDYMVNGLDPTKPYTANAELWSQFEDFDGASPTLAQVMKRYLWDLGLLFIWLTLAVSVATWQALRAVRGEVPTA